jgi:dTDP-4-dehydrorhamnose reductase
VKLLVTGAGGMLGQDVVAVARSQGHDVRALAHAELDITDASAVAGRIQRERPDAVVNCAAWTDVDGAEDGEERAAAVNVDGAGAVATAAAGVGASVIYPSTDYVFDGAKQGPYVESDDRAPLNTYGRTKLNGEGATAEANGQSFIVRTSWLFGAGGGNFVETMLRLASEHGAVTVVEDQVGCPTYTAHLAAGMMHLIGGREYGVHHMAGAGSCSWFEFAEEIFSQAGVACDITPTTSDATDRRAKRPANSVLASEREAPIILPPWQRGLADYLLALARSGTREPVR